MKIYLVGGAVRDIVMNTEPKDRDWVIVGATNEDVQRMLDEGYEQVGKDFPVFLHPVTKEEYALARTERKTGVGYGGFEVSTENVTLEEDLARRDLTMNAMAMDMDNQQIIDPFNGCRDIELRFIRHTTEAFSEDPLRALRVARLAARYGFHIAEETKELVKHIGEIGELNHLTPERIWLELQKTIKDGALALFLYHAQHLDVLKHCTFLSSLFGTTLTNKHVQVASRLKHLYPKDRYELAIAALARTKPMAGATRRMQEGFMLLREYGATVWTPEGVYDLIRVAGAYREGNSVSDLLNLIELTQPIKTCEVHIAVLTECISETKTVVAAQFPGIEGKALGDAIKAARINIISQILQAT